MKYPILLSAVFLPALLFSQASSRKIFTTTPTYDGIIAQYKTLATQSPFVKLEECGTTDAGKPLHLFIISRDKIFDPAKAKAAGKAILFINNGIHPGEPDGIDASIELVKSLIAKPADLPANLVICIIPVYNIGGCLNRGSFSRVNQNGPVQYGFRGNAKNLDLNRDFIKCDAQNTLSFEKIFTQWKPDVFVDTHVSDGADYQYVMTLIATQRNKLNPVLSKYMDENMVPFLYDAMQKKNYPMCPYVETLGNTPQSGITGFLETPRYSTGYAALFNCIGFVTETHMLKPYNDRVWATYELLKIFIDKTNSDARQIITLHAEADKNAALQKMFSLNWQLDTTSYTLFDFKGYEAKYKTSDVTGMQRLYYDEHSPYTQPVKFYNTYTAVTQANAPVYYVIPQAWTDVIARLKLNGVNMKKLSKDTVITVEVYYIADYKSPKTPYESHFVHSKTTVTHEMQQIQYYKGDEVVPVSQACNRYIVETLEPEGGDSFFAWNFFDGILQQKEWFSDYVFEDKADSILKNDLALKVQLDVQKKSDTAFAKDAWAQLSYIYRHSGYMEKTFNRYPVSRINSDMKLPLE